MWISILLMLVNLGKWIKTTYQKTGNYKTLPGNGSGEVLTASMIYHEKSKRTLVEYNCKITYNWKAF